MQHFHQNSRPWDITPKHTLERIQTNATSATIPQSHNPTHAHPQWRETTQVHRMQKVIQPGWKSEHSCLISSFTLGRIPTHVRSAKSHSDKLENWWSTYSSTVGKSHTVELQSAKSHSAILEPWADICLCTLGRSSTLVPSVKNHWSKWNSEEPFAHPVWREFAQMLRV